MFVFVQFMVQGLRRAQFTSQDDRTARLIVNSLAILVASIPIALPIVMQVTMAIGIRDLATTHRAVVTSVPALQDVASMSILCSDKTGTLTTAKITIVEDRVVTTEGWKKEDVLLYASAAANADKLGDPIDSAILRARASPCKSDGWVQGEAKRGAKRRASNAISSNENPHTLALPHNPPPPSVTNAITFIHHSNPFRDSLRSSQIGLLVSPLLLSAR